MDSGSVTHWIGELKAGRPEAAQPLWERYFARLVGLARKKLLDAPRQVADEEDIALSAFHSLCHCAREERFPRLNDRGDLWQVLVLLVARKAVNWRKHELRQKRGGGQARVGSGDDENDALAEIVGREPTPEFAAQVAEECDQLLAALPPELRQIAQWKLEGHTNEEIARKLDRAERTVERRVQIIRSTWEERSAADPG